jgi:hypothetical protein
VILIIDIQLSAGDLHCLLQENAGEAPPLLSLATTVSLSNEQMGRLGMAPLCLSINSALAWTGRCSGATENYIVYTIALIQLYYLYVVYYVPMYLGRYPTTGYYLRKAYYIAEL